MTVPGNAVPPFCNDTIMDKILETNPKNVTQFASTTARNWLLIDQLRTCLEFQPIS